ncbi:hypothetical protein K8R32_05325 [bacterium]|nr:hypothetical protein [bacterium]
MKNNDTSLDCVVLGFIAGIFVAIVASVFMAIHHDDIRDKKKRINNFYLMFQKYDSELDSNATMALLSMKKAVKYNISFDEFMRKELPDIEKYDSSFVYWKMFIEHYDKVVKLVNSEAKAEEFFVEIPAWSEWRKEVRNTSYVIIIMFMAGFYVSHRWFDNKQSLFTFPWKYWPVYPVILFMLPALIWPWILEVFYWLIVLIIALLGSFFESIRRAYQYLRVPKDKRAEIKAQRASVKKTGRYFEKEAKAKRKREDNLKREYGVKGYTRVDLIDLERMKNEALKTIEQVKRNMKSSCEAWADFFSNNIVDQKTRLEFKVENYREILKRLGVALQKKQKAYASTKKELYNWEETEKNLKVKERAEYIAEFKAILGLPDIIAIKTERNTFIAYTKLIKINQLGRVYEIGYFKIIIDMIYKNISIRNLSSTHPNGMDHPYGSGGQFCLGKTNNAIGTALRNCDFRIAITHILKNLKAWQGDNKTGVTQYMEVRA